MPGSRAAVQAAQGPSLRAWAQQVTTGRDLQDNLGHADSKTTDGYYPSTIGERAAAMERAFELTEPPRS